MDISTVTEFAPASGAAWRMGDAWLGGGTWLFSQPQLRGQVEGGVAQALGAALFEEVCLDDEGLVTTRALREYHVPVLADLPRTEVYFATTRDPLGPFGAKPMSEAPFNPVAPALANAVRDATGVRVTRLPLRRDRVYGVLNAVPNPEGSWSS